MIKRMLAWFKCKHVLVPGDRKCLRCGARLDR